MQSMWRSEMVSYPPPFRQTDLQEPASPDETLLNVHPNQKQPQQQTLGLDADLPFIDLLHPDPKVLGQACSDWGIFRLVNHGIPPQLTDRVRSYAKDLFALPFESKQSLFSTTSPIAYFWGSPNIQHSVLNLNRVEGFHSLLPKLALQQQQLQHDQPQELMFESFRCSLEEYGEHMARIGRSVFNVLADYLELDAAQKASYLAESDGFLRVYRYPCYLGDEKEVIGMDAHTDSSVLSIVNQDEVEGLQVLRDQKWVDVKHIPNTLIVNIGDMMQAMSNDKCMSVEHRVAANVKSDRMSICYFAFPKEDGVILSSNYKSFTYRQFQAQVQQDIKATGFKVGLDRFKNKGINGCDPTECEVTSI
ncbi:hypothetical protein AAC387_Pa01g4282 [Persea americana]